MDFAEKHPFRKSIVIQETGADTPYCALLPLLDEAPVLRDHILQSTSDTVIVEEFPNPVRTPQIRHRMINMSAANISFPRALRNAAVTTYIYQACCHHSISIVGFERQALRARLLRLTELQNRKIHCCGIRTTEVHA